MVQDRADLSPEVSKVPLRPDGTPKVSPKRAENEKGFEKILLFARDRADTGWHGVGADLDNSLMKSKAWGGTNFCAVQHVSGRSSGLGSLKYIFSNNFNTLHHPNALEKSTFRAVRSRFRAWQWDDLLLLFCWVRQVHR